MIRFLFGVITGLVAGILLFGTLLEAYEQAEDEALLDDEDAPSSAVV